MYPALIWRRIQFANQLRRNPTLSMQRLEEYMAARFGRDAFRRERVVGEHIADFYFPEERVVVEVDGASHDTIEQWVKDRHRDLQMGKRDVLVLRFRNEDVHSRSAWVMARIEAALAARGPAD